jgi:hypothetical protein
MRWTLAIPILAACGFDAPRLSSDASIGTDVPAGGDAPAAAWWDPAWPVRMRIAIDSAAALEAGFQLGLRRDLDAPPCDGPRDGVRVVRDHMTELPRVIDELGGDEWIWFRIAEARAAGTGPSEYWLYCGNAGAGPAPGDPAAVFELHDEFDGGAVSSAWRTQGGVTVGGGTVTLPGNNTGIRSDSLFGPGTATDFILQASSNALNNPWFWGGFEIGFTVTPPWVIWHSEDPNVIKQEVASGGNEVARNAQPLDLGAHLYGVEHLGTLARFRFRNAEVGSISYTGSINQMNVRIHNYQSAGAIQLLMARVRKAVNPIPTVTLGPVETRP